MGFHFEINVAHGLPLLQLPADRKDGYQELSKTKTEWPHRYRSDMPVLHYSSRQNLDKAKEGWTKTGKVYHLLGSDGKGNYVTHQYDEYFDGEYKFIVVEEYGEFSLRQVRPVKWGTRDGEQGVFTDVFDFPLYQELTDFPRNDIPWRIDERVLKDFVNKFFATEIVVDQRYEVEPPVLAAEMANRNYELKQRNQRLEEENHRLKEERAKLEEEKRRLEEEKAELAKEIAVVRRKLTKAERVQGEKESKLQQIKRAIENTNILTLSKLKEEVKVFGD